MDSFTPAIELIDSLSLIPGTDNIQTQKWRMADYFF
jgi:hypothetical protein